jgi:putative membrane protein
MRRPPRRAFSTGASGGDFLYGGHMRTATATALALVLFLVPSTAPTAAERAPTEAFVEQAAGRSLAGMELSDLALQRCESPAVRRLARRAHDEQAAAYEALLGVATGASSTLKPPSTMDLEQRGVKSRLAGLRGRAFDRAYVQALRTNEDRDIALYRSYAKDGKDEALKVWAADQLTLIRKRRQLIESTLAELK